MDWPRPFRSKSKPAPGTSPARGLVDQTNWKSVKFARERASDPDPASSLLWRVVADGLASNVGLRQIAANLLQVGYSAADAEAWAAYTIAESNSMAALAGYLEAEKVGVKLKKVWLATEDACEVCRANQQEGPIALRHRFTSGHLTPPAHLMCRCAISTEVER